MDYIVCHYHEIGLKGKNRRFFEEKLIENIKRALPARSFDFVRRISGRILVKLLEAPATGASASSKRRTEESLKNVFGLAFFAPAFNCRQDLASIQNKTLEILKGVKFKTFKIAAQRSKKEFSLSSQQVNEKVGEFILKKMKKKVDLEKPDVSVFIEIVDKYVFLYTQKIQGPGGLPVSSGGKAVALLSGGIDSPVAAFKTMKRGVRIVFAHFHAYPYTNRASIEKAKEIVKILNRYQFRSKLYLVPFSEIQKEILLKTPEKLRVIFYRRYMFRIAEEIAKTEKAKALVTGESLGQVASQTLENLGVIEEAVGLPVLRPLVGEDKKETIDSAKSIGTFEISILPDQDCCSRFLPKHPETRADLKAVKAAEKTLNLWRLLRKAIQNKTCLIY